MGTDYDDWLSDAYQRKFGVRPEDDPELMARARARLAEHMKEKHQAALSRYPLGKARTR